MPRIQPVNHTAATGDAKALLDGVKASIGVVPNIFATFAQSPKVLEGYLGANRSPWPSPAPMPVIIAPPRTRPSAR